MFSPNFIILLSYVLSENDTQKEQLRIQGEGKGDPAPHPPPRLNPKNNTI